MTESKRRQRGLNDAAPPCTDPWDPAYDEDFARSGIDRPDITVLPPDRFRNEAMNEQDARDLLGQWYEESREAGPRNSPTVEGRFAQVCCGWPEPPTASESQFLNNFAQPLKSAAKPPLNQERANG